MMGSEHPHPATILVVDDEEDIRDALSDFLQRVGYDVETAASGEGAVAALRTRPFDMVVSDLRMPGMDGIETMTAMRQIDAHLLFIIATAYASGSVEADCLKAGALQVIRKPFQLDHMKRIIADALRARAEGSAGSP